MGTGSPPSGRLWTRRSAGWPSTTTAGYIPRWATSAPGSTRNAGSRHSSTRPRDKGAKSYGIQGQGQRTSAVGAGRLSAGGPATHLAALLLVRLDRRLQAFKPTGRPRPAASPMKECGNRRSDPEPSRAPRNSAPASHVTGQLARHR